MSRVMNNKLSILFSVIVLSVGSYLIIKDFHKEQIKIWDESSSAKNAVDMYVNKNIIVQYDDGDPVRDDFKPPLSLWSKMIAYHFFGINEFSVRLPSIIAALLTMFALWYFGYFVLKRPSLGILFALILISSRGYVYYHVARNGDPDSLLVLFITLSFIFFYQLIQNYPTDKHRYLVLLGLSVLLGMYTKGIMGLAPFAGLGVYAITEKNGRKLLLDYKFYLMGIIALTLVAAYYILREYLDPGYMDGVLKYEIFSFREAPIYVKHPQFSFYFDYLENHGFKPFLYLSPAAILVYLFSTDRIIRNLLKYSFFAIIIFLLGMSSATMKNEWYIAPVYPYLAVFTGTLLAGIREVFHKRLPERYKKTIDVVFVAAICVFCFHPIKKIDQANHHYKHNVYYFEREGRFLNTVKQRHPHVKNIGVVIPHHTRQLEFYIKKFRYDDGTNTSIHKEVHAGLSGDTIIVCHDEEQAILNQMFDYELLDQDEYCILVRVKKRIADKEL
jgi:4-amino-4-deoxy-L-arabinose transferase-like glycosyltransferase